METEQVANVVAVGGLGAYALLAILWGLFVTVFWMVCAWRAMRAHEAVAASVEKYLARRD